MRSHSCVRVLLLLCLAFCQKGYTQDSTLSKTISLPDKLFSSIDKKTAAIESKLDKQTERYLSKLQKQENRLKKKLLKKDSTLAEELFQDVNGKYQSLQSVPQNVSKYSNDYSGHLDSLTTALGFLKNSDVASISNNPQLEKTLHHLHGLQGRLNQTDQVNKYLQERQQLLKEQFQKLGMTKELKQFKKQVYYYQAQVRAYKQVLEDPNKLEAKLMEIVMKLPEFKDFFSRNSLLGSLFALPTADGSTSASVQGLQTRAMLNEQLTQRFGSGVEVTQMLQQNVQEAQGQLSELKNKVSQYSNGFYRNNGDLEMPDLKPRNHQKTKSFFKRLEVGGYIQSQKARWGWPVTSDIATTLGYRLNDHSVGGIGLSGKVGLGSGWNDIKLSYQGIRLQSFLDWRIKGSFYATAGYEQNYRRAFKTIAQLRQYNAWSTSGLAGLTRKYNLSKKMKGSVQLLWDFLSYKQVPRTQTFLWRIGYSLK